MDQALRAIIDRTEIEELLTRYCRALDRLDEPLLRSCFHPDSVHHHGYKGSSEEFCGYAMDVLRACVATHHHLGNVSIRVDGHNADSECYFTAYHRLGPNPPAAFGAESAGMDLIIGGRYIDRHEKRGGQWRIVDRIGVHDWQRFEPAADRDFYVGENAGRGRRDSTDPVYRRVR